MCGARLSRSFVYTVHAFREETTVQPLNAVIASQITSERRDRAARARLGRSERPRVAFLARRRDAAAPSARPAGVT
jgi:hypothetical protein